MECQDSRLREIKEELSNGEKKWKGRRKEMG
jgi:hypothetical protein